MLRLDDDADERDEIRTIGAGRLASGVRTWLTMSAFLSRLPRGYIRHLERMVYQRYFRAAARRMGAESALGEAFLLMDLGLS
ncbi:MAG: hypothetical protein WAV18_23225 [Roseiarcus sp.]